MSSFHKNLYRFAQPTRGLALAAAILLGACAGLPPPPREGPGLTAPDPNAPRLPAVPTQHFSNIPEDEEVLGELQVVFAQHENTLVDIARAYNLGFDELHAANPGVDTWLPGEGTPVFLPTLFVVPAVPRQGLVLNLPSMRLLYFGSEDGAGGAPDGSVSTHPIGIGREGWETPTGVAKVTTKARDPTWYPPASVRAEHAELGDPLPAIVPPGPDNPLGRHVLGLSLPSYLIHGTNKPAGLGMRVSHGCIRLFPEDIEALFDRVPIGTPVRILDEPVLAGWRDGQLYLEVHPPLREDPRDLAAEADRVIAAALQRAGREDAAIDSDVVGRIVREARGIPFPVLQGQPAPDRFLAAARHIENDVPTGAKAPMAGQ